MRYAALVLAAVLCSIALVAFGQVPPAAASAAQPMALFTIVEGEVAVIRESRRLRAAEGMLLLAADIVQTEGEPALVRIELIDGGAIDLGPATAAQLAPRYSDPGGERAGLVYLMQGWLKLGSGPRLSAASARADLVDLQGTAVLHAGEGSLQIFMESGRGRLLERFDGRPAQAHALAEGETFLRRGGDAGVVTRRTVPQLLQAMPRPFTDILPLRAAAFQGRHPTPTAGEEIAYADVAAWINAERALRPGFVTRWRAKVRDQQFWKSLVAELPEHPEWHRVMYPEKYMAAAAAKRRAAAPSQTAPSQTAPSQAAPSQAAAGALQPASAPAEPHRLIVERGGVEPVAGLRPAAQ